MEIERKFIVSAPPTEFKELEASVMMQGYVSVCPTVRIRSKEKNGQTTYRLCFKGKGTLCREEIEIDVTKEKFDALAALIGKPLIRKEHIKYALDGGLVLEYNSVEPDAPTGFQYAEVEFESVEQANAFVLPEYLKNAKEVTLDGSWHMGAYWAKTRGNV